MHRAAVVLPQPEARQVRQSGVRDDGCAALEDSGDAVRRGEDRRIGRVLVQQDRVELIAGRYPAQPAADAAQLGAARGRGEQRRLDAQPGPVQQGDLGEVVPVVVAVTEVAAERDPHARVPRDSHGLTQPRPHRAGPVRPGSG